MSDLISRLDQFINRRVLCIGDVMLDRYIYGKVNRISPEAPIPVLHTQREIASLGGAANVVRNIAILGGKVDIVGVIGHDQAGGDVARAFEELPNTHAHLLFDATRPTTQKTRYVADNQQLLRADHESTKSVGNDIEQQALQLIALIMADVKVIILSDYAKGMLTPRIISETIKWGINKDKIIIIDPKGRDFTRYHGADYLTPNRKELSDVSGSPINNISEAEEAARSLIGKLQIDNIWLKLGAEGVCLVRKDMPALHLHTQAREVFDVSGAGDTVAATLALALASDFTPEESAEVANIAGSIVVGKVGTASVMRDEIERELMHGTTRLDDKKVVGVASIADHAERWRKLGLKVGFTNGCFDLLHPGHIALLRQAKAACDKLVVGLNSDASVKRLKGDRRPIQNEAARSAVLASLADVDYVVLFGEDTPIELIKTLHPDVLIKGADYAVESVVGAREVESWGGKVILAQLIEGQSTSKTIAKITK